jgi:ASC-1-like (ASCH) protein
MTEYIENLSEPWFSLISLGLKTIEGRKNKGIFKEMKIGDIITWTNNDFLSRKIRTQILEKKVYDTFQKYLETEGLINCLPGINDIESGLSVYYKYYSKEDEEKYGVISIKLKII